MVACLSRLFCDVCCLLRVACWLFVVVVCCLMLCVVSLLIVCCVSWIG